MNHTHSIIDPVHKSKLKTPFPISPQLELLLTTIKNAQGKGILVGGCVRDHLLGHLAKDIDIEVYGLPSDGLEQVLRKHFSVIAVGKTFGIFKVSVVVDGEKQSFDVALPRSENKSGQGHKGFVVSTDPQMSFEHASKRRDFTINAMGIDPDHGELFDAHGGAHDLKAHLLRHVSDAFKEDPLRVLRAAQFCARFDLTLDKETIALAKTLCQELLTLSKERIFEEMKKLLLANKPSLGLAVLRQTDALILFPELSALIDCPQDAEWHPEGDVWIHSLMVVDQAAHLVSQTELGDDDKLIVLLGALCHDLGKPLTTIIKDGRTKSPGHEQAGVEPTMQFLIKMGFPKKLHDDVADLVREHLKPHQLYSKRDEVTDGAIRRLCARVNMDRLLLVSQADFLGRTTKDALQGLDPSAGWLRQRVDELLGPDLTPRPVLLGRHLIALGLSPGTHFSKILKDAFEAQMDGAFSDETSALMWLKNHLRDH